MINEILTVCAGNICRSPMAQGLLQALLPEARVASAGLYAKEGMQIDPSAVRVMGDWGIDLTPHRARCLTGEMYAQADLILVMESAHKRAIDLQYPEGRGKVYCLDLSEDVPDPYGKPLEAYQTALTQIANHTEDWAKRIKAL